MAAASAHEAQPRRSKTVAGIVVVAFLAAWSATPVLLHGASDLDLFFWPAAQTAAHGHPLLIYSTKTPGGGPVANGPLGLAPLALIAWLADVGHWSSNAGLRTFASTAIFSVFVWLMAAQGVAAVQRGRGAVEWRLAAYAAFLGAPALWISVADFGHFEQPLELWLVLLSCTCLLIRRTVLAGFAMGLAMLTRTTALLYVVPLVLLLITSGQVRAGARYLVASAATAAAGIVPFLVADAPDVVHSLITYRSAVPIGGGSLWALNLGDGWQFVATHADTLLSLALAFTLCAAITVFRRGLAPSWVAVAGLLTVAAACFPMLARTAYPYYFVEPYVFGTVWWLARPGSALNWRLCVPVLVTADAILTKWGDVSPTTIVGVVNSLITSSVMLVVAALVVVDLAQARNRTGRHAATRALAAQPALPRSQG